MDIPVYFINGFLESGKTYFINTTLEDPEFINHDRVLLIACEEGIEEYDKEKLAKMDVFLEYCDEREAFTKDYLDKLSGTYHPDKVIVELNGVWKMEELLNMELPKNWVTVQVITLVNAQTYTNYINNMRSMIMEHLKYSDTIIFNRCEKDTPRLEIRRTIKPVNRKAQIIYESADGIDMGDDVEDELPFDVNADTIELEDDDFGLWYLDALDNAAKYAGKTMIFKAMFYKDRTMAKDSFVPGRFAMQCCANDIAFIGFFSRVSSEYKEFIETHQNKAWIKVKAEVRVEFRKEYRGKGPVLYVRELTDSEPADEEVVYFT